MSTLLEAWNALGQFKATPFPPDYPANVKHVFAPVDQVHDAFLSLLQCDDLSSLHASMYGWDDEQISDLFQAALTSACVLTVLCLDSSQAGGVHEREIIGKYPPGQMGNQVVIGRSSKGAINHDKLIVINRLVTICGSTNLSDSGEGKQNNEATIVYDRAFAGETVNRIDIIHSEMAAQMAAKGAIA